MMKNNKFRQIIKKTGAALASVCLAAVLMFLTAGFGHTAPENPMASQEADASRMYLTSSTLAMDQEKLASVENANISSGGADSAAAQEKEQEEQQDQRQEDQQNQQEDQENQELRQGQQNTNNYTSEQNTPSGQVSNSLLSLIQKNQSGNTQNGNTGGNGGGIGENGGGGEPGGDSGNTPTEGGSSHTLNPNQSSELFYTTIEDQKRTNDPNYPFTIHLTEKGKQLSISSITVVRNKDSKEGKLEEEDSLELEEGANFVEVILKFRSGRDEVTAPSKKYVLYYMPEGKVLLLVQNAKTGEYLTDGQQLTVYEDNIWLKVTAQKASGGQWTDVGHTLRLNNALKSAEADGIYRLGLDKGNNNEVMIRAGEAGNYSAQLSCSINYKVDGFVVSFESTGGFREDISDNRTMAKKSFGGVTSIDYKSESSDFAFRITCNTDTGEEQITSILVSSDQFPAQEEKLGQQGADGFIHIPLDASLGMTYIKMYCRNSDGETKSYIWEVKYTRVDNGENPGNDKNNPVIEISIADGQTVHDNPYTVKLKAWSHDQHTLQISQMKLYLNGQEKLNDSLTPDGFYEYNLELTEGANQIYVRVEDSEQYVTEKYLTLYFNADKESARVRFILSANVVGLGTLIDEYVDLEGSTTIARIVEDRLAAYAYTTIHDGSANDGSYFLRHIQKPGILQGWNVSEEERSLLEMEGIYLNEEITNLDSLGEKNFTEGSGWMITLNHYYIGQSMGTWTAGDGDEIHVLYTLDWGKDVGVDPNSGVYG